MNAIRKDLGPPLAVLLELTHRCPLSCPYCSNPLELDRARTELDTATWLRVIKEAAGIGALQVHFSGGEPLVRHDVAALVGAAHESGLYTNLLTSAVLLDEGRLVRLKAAGLDHVQISFQDSEAQNADRIAGFAGGYQKKIAAAHLVRKHDVALTINAVVHRQNIEHIPALIELALQLDAERIEIAQVQYYGWALLNRASLIPTREQVRRSVHLVAEARERLKGRLVIDHVLPDYYAKRPKACMGGWAHHFINITPAGLALPCQAAQSIKGMRFDSVREHSLREIWTSSEAFERFRGTAWMPEPCRSCDLREVDWGGCRCQAMAITGDASATDPACELSPYHAKLLAFAESESAATEVPEFTYRGYTRSRKTEPAAA